MTFTCSVNGNEYISLEDARTYREAAKRCAWGYVEGRGQKLTYVVPVQVIRDETKMFRVCISIYPHFDIREVMTNGEEKGKV
jgi:hypothetical protein